MGIYFLMAIFFSSKVDTIESKKVASKLESAKKSSKKDPRSYHSRKKIDSSEKVKTRPSKTKYKDEEEDVLEEPEDPLLKQEAEIEAAEEQQEIIQDGEVVDEVEEEKGDRNHAVSSTTMPLNAQDVSTVVLNGARAEVYVQRIPQAFKPDRLISASDASQPFFTAIYLSLSAVIIIYVFVCRKSSLLGERSEERSLSSNASKSTLLSSNDPESL